MRHPTDSSSPLTPSSLVATAIGIGRMAGEPASVLHTGRGTRLLAWLSGRRNHGPLADPRLEVVRAISAWLACGNNAIRGDLVAAAMSVGWSRDDLYSFFPAVAPGTPS